MVTFLLFARPLLLRLGGCHKTEPQYYQVTSAFEYKKKHGRREWLRARIAHSSSGELIAEKFSRDAI